MENAKIKRPGIKNWKDVKLKLPNKLKELITDYKIELVEDNHGYLSIFIVDGEEDIHSVTVNTKLKNPFGEGFKNLISLLESTKE